MKLRNFEIANIDVCVGDSKYDLHNNFNFLGFEYDVPSRTMWLRWRRATGNWAPDNDPRLLTLEFQGVSHFSATPRDDRVQFTEDDCLDSVNFVEPLEPTENRFMTSGPPDDKLHYVFTYMSGLALRIQADAAICTVD